MTLFRSLVALMFVVLFGYTGVVIARHGVGLFPIFVGDIARLNWSGQFNLDFMCLLALTGLWVSYRHRFRPVGILLGLTAFVGGVTFLSVYLLWESYRVDGNVAALLLGDHREGTS